MRLSIARLNHHMTVRLTFLYDDFDINATGTINVLEAARRFSSEAPFVFLSTNKVYGDRPEHDRAGGVGGALGFCGSKVSQWNS